MIPNFDFEAATARQKLRRAEIALKKAEELLDEGCGLVVNTALLNRIRIAARQAERAREAVRKIDPDCPDCHDRKSTVRKAGGAKPGQAAH